MPAEAELGASLPLWSALPFALLLLAIAFLPLATPHRWERNRNKALVSAALSLPILVWLPGAYGDAGAEPIVHSLLDYVSFIVLLGSLFVISGGVFIRGSLAGTPGANAALLGIGAVLANLVGTTGASVLLIRPLLRANRNRRRIAHIVVFFIFVVSNCGGLLTPLGDPPLFLGFLKGVPFTWTLGLWPQWLFVNGVLLAVFLVVDRRVFAREEAAAEGSLREEVLEHVPLGIRGTWNILFLLGIVVVILGRGRGWGFEGGQWPWGLQEALMATLAILAWNVTPHAIRAANSFSFAPIVEVAVLFLGIFITMTPPLMLLNARGSELGISQPWEYYWATGLLSSFLDNAPTYLTFAATAAGQAGASLADPAYLAHLLSAGPAAERVLTAISCGAVMMGANSYIGNGPNFMVKAIAEENGVRMPSFFGYMAYSGAVLIPIFLLVTLVFFR